MAPDNESNHQVQEDLSETQKTKSELYTKCSKILSTFLILFLNKILVFKAGIHKMLVRVANREDPDQTASSKAV